MPRILIPIPTSFDPAYNLRSWPEYAAAIDAEAIQVPLTHTPIELERLLEAADGVILPGSGADVDPARYGHDRDPATAPRDPARETTDFALIEAAERLHKPLLAICFGTQSLNVYRGGTLLQDLSPVPVNHAAGRSVLVAHTVLVSHGSRFGQIVSGPAVAAERTAVDEEFFKIPVNTSHHQAIGTPGEALRIVCRCTEDGVIEAVETADPDHWMIGVQWHPERSTHISASSRALFADFLRTAATRL